VFFELTSLLLPSFFSVILPITTFIVMLFVHLRLAGDRELVVMRAAGLSNWQIARPALALGLLVVGLMAFLNFWLVPLSHTAFRQWQFEIRNQLVGVLVQEGVFSSVGSDLTVYARRRDPDGTLRGIIVHDQREAGGAVTILAQSGRIGQGADGPRVTLYDGVRQQMEKGASGAPPRLTVLSFSENSVDLARVARNEETRSRDSRERSITELLYPDPSEDLRPRELRRFRSEAHQRMASPITALCFALVGLAVALTGQFRRHGGGAGVVLGVGIMVALLALGLTIGNAAARRDGLIWLIWLHAILPGVISAWWLAGAPGLPRKAPPREALT
jgi:lipopolysaccharide export system permease protein